MDNLDFRLNWSKPSLLPPLGDRDTHVWCAHVSQFLQSGSQCLAVLNEEERERAHRFHFERDRQSYIVSHAMLRFVLGHYLNHRPSELAFQTTHRGKPYLSHGPVSGRQLTFNLSHSQGITLLAVTWDADIGVDVEKLRTMSDAQGVADRFFSQRESAQLAVLDPEELKLGFFNAWTRKEAILKGLGRGITDGLDKVEVTFKPEDSVRLIGLDSAWGNSDDWTLINLDPCAGYCAALAIKASEANLSCYSWEPPQPNPASAKPG
jgi:4'-phosphopantetheinyl transferase